MIRVLKWSLLIFLNLFLIFFLSVIITFWPDKPTTVPVIKFHYSSVIDRYFCASKAQAKILPAWHTELDSTLPLLQSEWNKDGPALLAETSRLTTKPFSHSKIDVPVFLCPDLNGFGFPLIVPVRMFLKTAVNKKQWQKTDFVDIVFHELLHVYVVRTLHWNIWTPLVRKYSNESFDTKIHLHLFALQKAVYLQLGMKKRWQFVVALNKQFSRTYSRAIDILDEEGYEAFIDEMRR